MIIRIKNIRSISSNKTYKFMSNTEKQEIAQEILTMCKSRGAAKTICPSEVARKLYPDNWRDQMDIVRAVAFKLAKDNRIAVTQKGKAITDYTNIKGPIRLRIVPKYAQAQLVFNKPKKSQE